MVGLLVSAIEPYCLFPPCITCMANREVVGIVTKINHPDANVKRAESWLRLAGCKKNFCGFQNLGRGGGNPGISPGGRRCDALGAGKQKTTIKNNKNNIICTEKST